MLEISQIRENVLHDDCDPKQANFFNSAHKTQKLSQSHSFVPSTPSTHKPTIFDSDLQKNNALPAPPKKIEVTPISTQKVNDLYNYLVNKLKNKSDENSKVESIPSVPPSTIHNLPPAPPTKFKGDHLSTSQVFDVFLLLLIVYIVYREQSKLGRKAERDLQLEHKIKECQNLLKQAKWTRNLAVFGGIMGIAGGFAPILGRFAGPQIQGLLGYVSTRLGTMKERELFNNIQKMLEATHQTNNAYTQVIHLKGEGNRKMDEEHNVIARTLAEEFSTEMREESDNFHGFLRFLQMLAEMDERTISNLYH